MNLHKLILLIGKSNTQWYKVNNAPCVHTFVGDFCVNLCRWKDGEIYKISIDVDNIKKNHPNVIHEKLIENTEKYNSILPIYNLALNTATLPSFMEKAG